MRKFNVERIRVNIGEEFRLRIDKQNPVFVRYEESKRKCLDCSFRDNRHLCYICDCDVEESGVFKIIEDGDKRDSGLPELSDNK